MSDSHQTVTIDEETLEGLREVPVGWDLCEVGAPYLAYDDEVPDHALALLEILLQEGELAPGDYAYSKPEGMDFSFHAEALEDDSTFSFTDEHRQLLKAVALDMSEVDTADEEVPGVDPKRPYGAFTFYQLEMADHLKLLPEGFQQEQGLPEGMEERLTDLHHQMQPALQVFLREASLQPGTFERQGYDAWTRSA